MNLNTEFQYLSVDVANDLIQLYQATTFSFQIAVTDSEDAVFDLTGYTLNIVVKCGSSPAVIDEDQACTTSPELGMAYGVLSSEDTDIDVKTYDYYIRIYNTDDPAVVHMLAKGKMKILRGI